MTTANASAIMDPWGGGSGGSGGETGSNSLGFDDDFSDAAAVAEAGHRLPSSQHLSPIFPLSAPDSDVSHARKDVGTDSAVRPAAEASLVSSPPPPPPLQPAAVFPSLAPLNDPLSQILSSEEYISRLEAKLRRIKGGGGGGGGGGSNGKKGFSSSAKLMIDALSTVKESNGLLSSDGSDTFSDSSRVDIAPNSLLQRAFPERTPLTREELEWLVNHDQLQPPDDHDVEK